MEPVLTGGDITVYAPGNYEIGDIIIFRSPYGGNIIHRIVGKYDGVYITKGDNNGGVDAYLVTEEMIIGKLLFKVSGFQ